MQSLLSSCKILTAKSTGTSKYQIENKLEKFNTLRLITGSYLRKLSILDFILLAAGCSSFRTYKRRDLKSLSLEEYDLRREIEFLWLKRVGGAGGGDGGYLYSSV